MSVGPDVDLGDAFRKWDTVKYSDDPLEQFDDHKFFRYRMKCDPYGYCAKQFLLLY